MREVTVTTHVAAAPERVFAIIADPRKPFLTGNAFAHVEVVGEQTTGVGTVFRWTFTFPLGVRLSFDERVTEWVEPRWFAYCAVSGWQMEAVSALEPENSGTRVTFTLRYSLPGIWQWLIPRWLEQLGSERAIANIKRLAELKASQPGEPRARATR